MPYRVYIVEAPTLLADLLEDSGRIYHRNCAIIQRAFHKEWLKTLGEHIAQEQIDHPDDKPARVEARVRQRLQRYKRALAAGQLEMIREQERKRRLRDEAIRAYVESRAGQEAHAA